MEISFLSKLPNPIVEGEYVGMGPLCLCRNLSPQPVSSLAELLSLIEYGNYNEGLLDMLYLFLIPEARRF
jgi:hypothetical protein